MQTHREVMQALASGEKVRCGLITFAINDAGEIQGWHDQGGLCSFCLDVAHPAEAFSLVPSQTYYIPKSNKYAYAVLDNCQLTCYAFNGMVLSQVEDFGSLPLKNEEFVSPVTKEQAERRVNSWWCKKWNCSDDEFIKIENGVAYHRRRIEYKWSEFTSIDRAFEIIKRAPLTRITRAECEAAFRETFGFEVAMRHLLDGKTVARRDSDGEQCLYKIFNGINYTSCQNTNWVACPITRRDLTAQYWLAE